MSRVVHFEIGAADPERSAAFYQAVFGWSVQKWNGPEEYWLVSTGQNGPGIDGGFFRSKDSTPLTVNTISVDSVDAFVERIVAEGGTVAMPKGALPGVGYLAYCKDPQGVLFGLIQEDRTAA
jgi:predicted enzyme related to lactoylglutathione lyase